MKRVTNMKVTRTETESCRHTEIVDNVTTHVWSDFVTSVYRCVTDDKAWCYSLEACLFQLIDTQAQSVLKHCA